MLNYTRKHKQILLKKQKTERFAPFFVQVTSPDFYSHNPRVASFCANFLFLPFENIQSYQNRSNTQFSHSYLLLSAERRQILRKFSGSSFRSRINIRRVGENAEIYQNMRLSVIATAAEYYYYCKDDDPSAVVIKDVAQAVIIHMFASGS